MKNLDVDSLLRNLFADTQGVSLREQFEVKLSEYGLSRTRALKLLAIDKDVFEEIIAGTAKQPNLIHIVKIAEFLDVGIGEFVQMVLKNQSSENIASLDSSRKATFLLKNFDVKTLTKLGFFESNSGTDQMVQKVLDFFGFASIAEFEEQLDEPLYSRARRSFSDKMKNFWIKSAYRTFRLINNSNEYNRDKLKELIVNIKPYSQDVRSGLFTVCKALYNVGVTVIFQNYLSTTQVRGATFIINGRPCIVITDFMKKYPSLWFTLLHELHHVLFDFATIEGVSFHLSGSSDLFLIEEKADSFARDFFLSPERFHYIKRYINNPFLVSKFAKEQELHESLVYSFFTWYQKHLYGKDFHAAFRDFYPTYEEAVAKLNPIAWDKDNIKIASEKIKEVLEIQS